jgi:hypothetical protein
LPDIKKRVISLEDEMLLNHSRILDLEKQVAQLKEENAKLNTTCTFAEDGIKSVLSSLI